VIVMGRKMSKAMARKRLDEARAKLLRVMRFADLEARQSMDLFKLSNDILRFSNRLK
jgi:hypothetical protein